MEQIERVNGSACGFRFKACRWRFSWQAILLKSGKASSAKPTTTRNYLKEKPTTKLHSVPEIHKEECGTRGKTNALWNETNSVAQVPTEHLLWGVSAAGVQGFLLVAISWWKSTSVNCCKTLLYLPVDDDDNYCPVILCKIFRYMPTIMVSGCGVCL